jgi:hypothetical protein
MTYCKPELTVLSSAICAIQNSETIKNGTTAESQSPPNMAVAAYEADE